MYISLTPDQQKDLIRALGVPGIGLIDTARVKLVDYKRHYEDPVGVHHLLIKFQLLDYGADLSFTLKVGYLNTATKRNPETIALHQIDDEDPDSPMLLLVGGLGYATDKLREYGIWK